MKFVSAVGESLESFNKTTPGGASRLVRDRKFYDHLGNFINARKNKDEKGVQRFGERAGLYNVPTNGRYDS